MSGPHDDAHERIGEAIRAAAADVDAPAGLRARVAAEREAARARGRRRARGWALGSAAAAALAAVAVALVVVLGSSSPGAPAPADAAAAALSAPDRPAPAVDRTDPRFVEAAVGGVRFPNYAYDSAWRAVGARTAPLGDREVTTVVYARSGARVGYAIVDGPVIGFPEGSRKLDAGGVPVWVASQDGATVVVWERDGHTCVLASRDATLPQILGFVGAREA